MADNAQKTPLAQTLNRWADKKIDSAASLLGKSFPASVLGVDGTGTIVTVKLEVQGAPFKFPDITCPVYGPQWVRWPLQAGDPGVCFSSDLYLGGMSGLGGGVAGLTQMMNLGSLVWFPIGNSNFDQTENPNAVVIYGPDGTVLKTTAGNEGKLTVNAGGVEQKYAEETRTEVDAEGFKVFINNVLKLLVNANGLKMFTASGNFGVDVTETGTFIDGVNFLPHIHNNVQPGIGNSGPVVP